MSKMKDSTILAKLTALDNAHEFIRGHGEEGGIDENQFDDFTEAEYLKQCKWVAKVIDRYRNSFAKKHGYRRANPIPKQ